MGRGQLRIEIKKMAVTLGFSTFLLEYCILYRLGYLIDVRSNSRAMQTYSRCFMSTAALSNRHNAELSI